MSTPPYDPSDESPTAQAPDPQTTVRTVRTLSMVMCAGLPVIGLLALVRADTTSGPSVAPWALGVPVVVAVALHLLLEAFGYRTAPLSPDDDERTRTFQSLRSWQLGTLVRLVACEGTAGIGALVFVGSDATDLTVLWLGLGLVALVMWWHGVPREGSVNRVTKYLEAAGARSPLPELTGYPRT